MATAKNAMMRASEILEELHPRRRTIAQTPAGADEKIAQTKLWNKLCGEGKVLRAGAGWDGAW